MHKLILATRAESEWLNVLEALLVIGGVAYVCFLILLIRRRELVNIPIRLVDLFVWSRDLTTSASQIQKSYDWQIAQWSSFGTAVLTATLGFISAIVLEVWKGTQLAEGKDKYIVIALGLISSLALYAVCQLRIKILRARFVRLYSALVLLS
jgi:hypothetical protein